MTSERWQSVLLGAFGIGLFLVAWEVIGTNRLAGLTWPPLSTVLAFMFDSSRAQLFGRAMEASFSMVFLGYATGALLGMALATG